MVTWKWYDIYWWRINYYKDFSNLTGKWFLKIGDTFLLSILTVSFLGEIWLPPFLISVGAKYLIMQLCLLFNIFSIFESILASNLKTLNWKVQKMLKSLNDYYKNFKFFTY